METLTTITPPAKSVAPLRLVEIKAFLQATRDSGYSNLGSAVAEIVDNSLQAEGTEIDVFLSRPGEETDDLEIAVLDNGLGMSESELAKALRFGGSNRFNDRHGLGRFGMGLPNSSLSQARRVDVYSWRDRRHVIHTYLDLDELLASPNPVLPPPSRSQVPALYSLAAQSQGTLVIWTKLDRVKTGAWYLLLHRLDHFLGQKFRHFLWGNCEIRINGQSIIPFDPLFLSSSNRVPNVIAQPYGPPLEFHVPFDAPGKATSYASVQVQFAELPVQALAGLSSRDKRLQGITNRAGVSIIRAGREIDYGWFFLDKRRENYDDWWRCEVRFLPDLDEAFGVTHTKQGIRPTEDLRTLLTSEMTAIARKLNRRVQLAHMDFASREADGASVQIASSKDSLLHPLPNTDGEMASDELRRRTDRLYRLDEAELESPMFCQAKMEGDEVVFTINTLHAFYERVYRPLKEADSNIAGPVRTQLELVLLALGRCSLLDRWGRDAGFIEDFMREWSATIASFCRTS